MASREILQRKLETLSGWPSSRVLYAPPENIRLAYPCIVYKRQQVDLAHADNHPLLRMDKYRVTIISRETDEPVIDTLLMQMTASFVSDFASEGLNHTILDLYQIGE